MFATNDRPSVSSNMRPSRNGVTNFALIDWASASDRACAMTGASTSAGICASIGIGLQMS